MKQLSEIFGEQFSLFNISYNYLKLIKWKADNCDFCTFCELQMPKNFNCSCLWKISSNALFLSLDFSQHRCSHSTIKTWVTKTLQEKILQPSNTLNLKNDTQMVQVVKSSTTNRIKARENTTNASKKRPQTAY